VDAFQPLAMGVPTVDSAGVEAKLEFEIATVGRCRLIISKPVLKAPPGFSAGNEHMINCFQTHLRCYTMEP